jgi:hypothetical protein
VEVPPQKATTDATRRRKFWRKLLRRLAILFLSHGTGGLLSCNQVYTSSLSFAADMHLNQFHGQPFARAHRSTSRCPPNAAPRHVSTSHRHPFARAHCSTSRCLPSAAHEHVILFHGKPFARAH